MIPSARQNSVIEWKINEEHNSNKQSIMPTVSTLPKTTQPNKPPTEKIRVACLGDSITEFSGYPEYAAKILGAYYDIGNYGACGTTISFDSDRPYIHSEAFDNARRFQPDFAVIMLGTNDADSSINHAQSTLRVDLLALIEKLQIAASKPSVYLVRPPPIFSDWGGLNGKALIKEIIPAIEQTAECLKLPLIDVFSSLNNPSYFFDGVHPNDAGTKIIADVICRAII